MYSDANFRSGNGMPMFAHILLQNNYKDACAHRSNEFTDHTWILQASWTPSQKRCTTLFGTAVPFGPAGEMVIWCLPVQGGG